jgi:hypothetical protein
VVYGDSGYSDYSGYSTYSGSSGYSDSDYSYVGYALAAAGGYAWGYYNWRDGYASVNYNNYYNNNYSRNWNNNVKNAGNNINNLNRNVANSSWRLPTQGQGAWQHNPAHRGNAPYGNSNLANRFGQGNNRLAAGARNRTLQPGKASAGNQAVRANSARPNGAGARPSTGHSNLGAPNRVGNHVPSNWPSGARGGAFGPSNGNLARAFSGRGAQSMSPSKMGPPQGLRAGGPPIGGFRGGPPVGGGFPGGPPMGGGLPGGGLPVAGAPPPPPPPPPP